MLAIPKIYASLAIESREYGAHTHQLPIIIIQSEWKRESSEGSEENVGGKEWKVFTVCWKAKSSAENKNSCCLKCGSPLLPSSVFMFVKIIVLNVNKCMHFIY